MPGFGKEDAKGLLLFDYNGTLIDDLERVYAGVAHVFTKFGIEPPGVDAYRAEVAGDFMPFYWNRGIPQQITGEELFDLWLAGVDESGIEGKLFLDARKVLELLRYRGYALALVSGFNHGKLHPQLAEHGIAEFFDSVIGSVSRDKKEAFLHEMRRARVVGVETAVIGDQIGDVLAAKEAGARPFACVRGYHARNRFEELGSKCPYLTIVDSLEDLLPHFP